MFLVALLFLKVGGKASRLSQDSALEPHSLQTETGCVSGYVSDHVLENAFTNVYCDVIACVVYQSGSLLEQLGHHGTVPHLDGNVQGCVAM